MGNDFKATLNEFVGSVIFFMLAFGGLQAVRYISVLGGTTATNGAPPIELLLYWALTFGLAFLATSWIFYRVSGGMFNPVVSLALALTARISIRRFLMFSIAQIAGAIAAAAIIRALTPDPLLVGISLSPRVNKPQGLFIEMFATAFLVLSILMLTAERPFIAGGNTTNQTHHPNPLSPIGIGLVYFVCELWTVPFTGGALNPARAFGPATITNFPGHHWVYWVGPVLGALLASAFYHWLKFANYSIPHTGRNTAYDSPYGWGNEKGYDRGGNYGDNQPLRGDTGVPREGYAAGAHHV